MSRPSDLIQGTLDLLILKTVALEPKHGWAIAKRIQQMSRDVLQITQGSLYPALHRLEQQGWLKAQAGLTDTGREAKFYALTAAGRKQLARELESWDRLSTAIGLVVREAEYGSHLDVANARQDPPQARARSSAAARPTRRSRARSAPHLQEQIDENIARA